MSTHLIIAGSLLGLAFVTTTLSAQTNQNRRTDRTNTAATRGAAQQEQVAAADNTGLTADQQAVVRRWLQQGGRLDPATQQALIDEAMLGGFLTAEQYESLQNGQALDASQLRQLRQLVQNSGMFDPALSAMRRWVQDGGLLTADQQRQILDAIQNGDFLDQSHQAELQNWLENGMLDPTQMEQLRDWLNDHQLGQNQPRTGDDRADRRAERREEFIDRVLDDGLLSTSQERQLQTWLADGGTLNRDQFQQIRDWVRENQDRESARADRRANRLDNAGNASRPGHTSPREAAARAGSVQQARELLSPQKNLNPPDRSSQPDLQPGDANGITRNEATANIAGPAFANPPVTDNPPGGAVGIRQAPANPNGTPILPGQFGNRNGNSGNRGNTATARTSSSTRGQLSQGQTQSSQGQSGGQGQSQSGGTDPSFAGPVYDTGASAAFQDPYGYSAYGDMLHGQADIIRSQGSYNLQTAAAASTGEDARTKYYDNSTKQVATYFQRKAIHDSYVHPDEPLSLKRYKSESLERLKAESEMAKKLNRKQFDPAMATVYWPGVLQGEEFAEHREEIADLMAQRSPENSGLGSENYRQVRQATEEMHEELQEQVLEIPSDEYMVAKRFVDGIKHEARMVADNPQVAARHD